MSNSSSGTVHRTFARQLPFSHPLTHLSKNVRKRTIFGLKTSLETAAKIAMTFNFYWMLPSAYEVPALYDFILYY